MGEITLQKQLAYHYPQPLCHFPYITSSLYARPCFGCVQPSFEVHYGVNPWFSDIRIENCASERGGDSDF